jgi:hypothetical protein
MGENSLTPHRDATEAMLAGYAAEEKRLKARPGAEGVTARMALGLSSAMSRLIADEIDAGSDMFDIYTAACQGLVNAAGSAGASLLVGHDTVTGAVEALKDALELAEGRVGEPPQCLLAAVAGPAGGRA